MRVAEMALRKLTHSVTHSYLSRFSCSFSERRRSEGVCLAARSRVGEGARRGQGEDTFRAGVREAKSKAEDARQALWSVCG